MGEILSGFGTGAQGDFVGAGAGLFAVSIAFCVLGEGEDAPFCFACAAAPGRKIVFGGPVSLGFFRACRFGFAASAGFGACGGGIA